MISRSTLIGALVVAELAILGIAARSLGLGHGNVRWGPQPAAAAVAPPVHERYETGSAPAVHVDLGNASVEIVAADAPLVEVVETRDPGWSGDSTIVARRDGDTIRIGEQQQNSGWKRWNFNIHSSGRVVRVTLPRQARVDVSDGNGRVSATGLRTALRIETSNGRVTVADHQGDLSVESSNGRIDLNRVDAAHLHGETSNARITATDVVLRDGSLTSSNGSITVEAGNGSDATVQLDGRNVPQDEDGRVVRLGAGRGRFTLETSNGSIRLTQKATG